MEDSVTKIFIGADHRGFALKEEIMRALGERGASVIDCGAHTYDPNDDYPDYAVPVARGVAEEASARGILLCGSGLGMDIAANKVRGARATVGYSRDAIEHARSHDDTNIITLAADELSASQALELVDIFLSTPFSDQERHKRRTEKIAAIEDEYCV